ncbi:MAG TPA: zinc ribbon domain-containing protein [Promineifilum sp.]|nr:zinc ribbon domain-containing protein [Promineifilum sp.]
MDEKDPLQAYTAQIVALGQAALAHYRRGESLPEALGGLAAALLALEDELRPPTTKAAPADTASAVDPTVGPTPAEDESPAGAGQMAPLSASPALVDDWLPAGVGLTEAIPADQPVAAELPLPAGLAPPGPTAVFGDDNAPETPGEVDLAAMTPVEDNDWLTQFAEESSGMLVIREDETSETPGEQPLVVAVEEEAGDPAVVASPMEALPPLVSAPVSLPADEAAWPGTATEPAAVPAAGPPAAPELAASELTTELKYCTNCGAPLRPGRRFCYRCGASVAEMAAEVGAGAPPAAEPALPPVPARPPVPEPPPASGPSSEWPTIVGDVPNFEDVATAPPASLPALARFCNNCGLGVAAGVTVCPECGGRDFT